VLRLTPSSPNQAGSAFNLNAIQLGNSVSFSTAFAFQLTAGGGSLSDGNQPPAPPGADGIVFVLNITTNNVGALGQGFGYQGIPNPIGIKFDTWQDGVANGFPQDIDPTGNFVAVYTNGGTQTAGYLPYSPGNPGTTPQYYAPTTFMKNGDVWFAWIDYDGSTHRLDVRLSDGVNVRPSNPQLSQTIDLGNASILGSSPQVFAGFTSATGAQYNNQDILFWQFDTSYNPIGIPLLNIARSNNSLRIYWQSVLTDFHLQVITNLSTPNWITPPQTVSDDGTNRSIVVDRRECLLSAKVSLATSIGVESLSPAWMMGGDCFSGWPRMLVGQDGFESRWGLFSTPADAA
jgi:Legume lectin domain